MAGLFGQAIVALCLGSVGSYNEACKKAIDAGSRQTGIRQRVDFFEAKTDEILMRHTMTFIGEDGVYVVGIGGFVYKTFKDKSLKFKLPTLGMCDSLGNQITAKSYGLTMEWKW